MTWSDSESRDVAASADDMTDAHRIVTPLIEDLRAAALLFAATRAPEHATNLRASWDRLAARLRLP